MKKSEWWGYKNPPTNFKKILDKSNSICYNKLYKTKGIKKMVVTKEKNFIIFTNDENKAVRLDINTGIMYGVSGKPLKRMNAEVATYLRNVSANRCMLVLRVFTDNYWTINDMYCNKIKGNYLEVLQMLDKFQSIGYNFKDRNSVRNLSKVEFNKYFAKFSKAFKNDNTITYSDFIEETKKQDFLIKNKINLENPYLTEEVIQFVKGMNNGYTPKQIKFLINVLTYGRLYDSFYSIQDLGIYRLKSVLRKYLELCELLEADFDEKNPIKHLGLLNVLYQQRKDELMGKKLETVQMRKKEALTFEWGEYFVKIPTTVEEFRKEGENNRNCVAGYTNYVSNGDCFVVFIRKKDEPDKSVITCEISMNGSIRQFNAYCNKAINSEKSDKTLYDLRLAYQEHLYEHWN